MIAPRFCHFQPRFVTKQATSMLIYPIRTDLPTLLLIVALIPGPAATLLMQRGYPNANQWVDRALRLRKKSILSFQRMAFASWFPNLHLVKNRVRFGN